MRRAFTIIEIFVSVMIISVVILGITKIAQRNISMAHYIGVRANSELQNSLFLAVTFDMDLKNKQIDAYSILKNRIKLKDGKARDILKHIERNVTISEPIDIGDVELPVDVEIRAIMIKGDYSARYYGVSLQGKDK